MKTRPGSNAGVEVTGVVERFSYKGGMPYLAVPRAVAEELRGESGPARLVCTIGKVSFQCGLMSLGQGDSYVLLTKKVRDATGVDVGGRVVARLRVDESPYGLPMPEELGEVLAQDEDGAQVFEKLTPGRRRGIIAMVSRHKSVDARVEHAVAVIEAIKEGETDLKRLARARLRRRDIG
jgi:hypothetical protein